MTKTRLRVAGLNNFGFANAGVGNIGADNSGTANWGLGNSGSFNTGWHNAGSFNTFDGNAGNGNTGWWNAGYTNTGVGNGGLFNTGFGNAGNFNTGFSGAGTPFDANAAIVTNTANSGFNNVGNFVSGYENTGSVDPGFLANLGNPGDLTALPNAGITIGQFVQLLSPEGYQQILATPGGTTLLGFGGVSGYHNSAIGGAFNGAVSGILNTGVPKISPLLGPGDVSGLNTGVGNTGTGTFGWFNLVSTLQGLL